MSTTALVHNNSTQPVQPTVVHAGWAALRCAAYLQGKGISFGCGGAGPYPQSATDPGKFSINIDNQPSSAVVICDNNLAVIAKSSLDHVFCASRILQYSDPDILIQEFTDRLREGGHFILHLSKEPDIEKIEGWLSKAALWRRKDQYTREGQFLGIWKLIGKQRRGIQDAKPQPKKRALIARYGAIGDMIMISPLIKQLAEDGYAVTMNITPYCAEVLKHNPHVSNIIVQERDAVPNPALGHYWREWLNDYDKYINLSESIEGKLLKVEGRRDFYTSKEWRQSVCDVNYYDQTMRLGGYPDAKGRRGEMYFSNAELKAAGHFRKRYPGKYLVLWVLRGSSHHKYYANAEQTLRIWLDKHPDAIVMLTGGPDAVHMQFEHPQVLSTATQIPLREIFALTSMVDLVVGPETAVTNCAACYDTPKIIFLSHSTHENLCKYWTNHECLTPEVECYPCHQLHYSYDSCPIVEHVEEGKVMATAPACSGAGYKHERVLRALDVAYDAWAFSKSATA